MADRFHQLVLFWDSHYGGQHMHVFRSLAYVGDHFNDQTSSLAIMSGLWSLYVDSNFATPTGGVFAPGAYEWVEDYAIPNDALSSAALLDDSSADTPHLILFKDLEWGGDHRHVVGDVASPGGWSGMRSFVVLAGTWELTTTSGTTFTFGPGIWGDASAAGVAPGSLASIRLVGPASPAEPIPHVIAFWDKDFWGAHRHIFTAYGNLGSWAGQISSFVVEAGTWQMFRGADWKDAEGPVLTRGLYNWVEDVEIDNDSVTSVSIVRAPAPGPSLVTALNDGQNSLVFNGNPYRLGWNPHETTLTPSTVRNPGFGQLWYTPVGARVYGQPLYAQGVRLPSGQTQDLLIVGTAEIEVYALDPATGAVVWRQELPSDQPLDNAEFGAGVSGGYSCLNTSPTHGINSTPAIDRSRNRVYVANIAKNGNQGEHRQEYRVHALDLSTGNVLFTTKLAGSFGSETFAAYMHTQRGALALVGSHVLVPFSSRCDNYGNDGAIWRGWLFAVNLDTGAIDSVICVTQGPDGGNGVGGGGIWGPGGPAVDDAGNVYAVSGNGRWDGEINFGNTLLKFAEGALAIPPADFYTPHNQGYLAANDLDVGGSSAVLLPSVPQEVPIAQNLAVTGGKDGRLRFVNRDSLGHLGHAVYCPTVSSDIVVTPGYFDAGPAGRFVYTCASKSAMLAVKFDDLQGATMLGARVIQFEGGGLDAPGSPFVSSNGNDGGVLWCVESRRGEHDDGPGSRLLAWDAVSGGLLYRSPTVGSDALGDGRKFLPPLVLGGRVFVSTNGVTCYGLH